MSSYVTKPTPGDTAWFTHDRFGMFIHFGLYSMPARHEWVKTRERTRKKSMTCILSTLTRTCMTRRTGHAAPKQPVCAMQCLPPSTTRASACSTASTPITNAPTHRRAEI